MTNHVLASERAPPAPPHGVKVVNHKPQDQVRPLAESCKRLFPEWKEVSDRLGVPESVLSYPDSYSRRQRDCIAKQEFLNMIETATGDFHLVSGSLSHHNYYSDGYGALAALKARLQYAERFRLFVWNGGRIMGNAQKGSPFLDWLSEMITAFPGRVFFHELTHRPEFQFSYSASPRRLVLHAPHREFEDLRIRFVWQSGVPSSEEIISTLSTLATNPSKGPTTPERAKTRIVSEAELMDCPSLPAELGTR